MLVCRDLWEMIACLDFWDWLWVRNLTVFSFPFSTMLDCFAEVYSRREFWAIILYNLLKVVRIELCDLSFMMHCFGQQGTHSFDCLVQEYDFLGSPAKILTLQRRSIDYIITFQICWNYCLGANLLILHRRDAPRLICCFPLRWFPYLVHFCNFIDVSDFCKWDH